MTELPDATGCWNNQCVLTSCNGVHHVECGYFGPVFPYREQGKPEADHTWRGEPLPIVAGQACE